MLIVKLRVPKATLQAIVNRNSDAVQDGSNTTAPQSRFHLRPRVEINREDTEDEDEDKDSGVAQNKSPRKFKKGDRADLNDVLPETVGEYSGVVLERFPGKVPSQKPVARRTIEKVDEDDSDGEDEQVDVPEYAPIPRTKKAPKTPLVSRPQEDFEAAMILLSMRYDTPTPEQLRSRTEVDAAGALLSMRNDDSANEPADPYTVDDMDIDESQPQSFAAKTGRFVSVIDQYTPKEMDAAVALLALKANVTDRPNDKGKSPIPREEGIDVDMESDSTLSEPPSDLEEPGSLNADKPKPITDREFLKMAETHSIPDIARIRDMHHSSVARKINHILPRVAREMEQDEATFKKLFDERRFANGAVTHHGLKIAAGKARGRATRKEGERSKKS